MRLPPHDGLPNQLPGYQHHCHIPGTNNADSNAQLHTDILQEFKTYKAVELELIGVITSTAIWANYI